eukprot:gb/GECG01003133.1/.p1 GENE.gb/GECG01003133.1/~~gb/GECG01003133.1/.p1  ORF type:complete len:184 (+),score=16.75 gb/GECG01003133.1/:1-552(+)
MRGTRQRVVFATPRHVILFKCLNVQPAVLLEKHGLRLRRVILLKKSNRVGKRRSLEKSKSTKGAEEHEKNLKHTAECQRDYALQEDIVVASENHEETIVRIVNFYSTDRKLLLVSPYRSPRQCGNHRWMGTRELFFAPSTTYVVPTTAVRRKASVWSLVSELPSSEDARCHEFTFHYTYFGTE